MNRPKLLVTAPARSGTGFAAAVLNAAGIPCGHEQVFGLRAAGEWAGFAAESSWLAVPHLPLEGVRVGLQLRDPMAVLRSLVGIGLGRPRYRRYAERALPGLADQQSAEAWAAHYIVGWVEMIEPHADVSWRVEDRDADALARLTETPAAELASAIAATPPNVNHRRRAERLNLDSIPRQTRERLAALAARHGYACEL